MELGERLKQLRKKNKKTQEQLSNDLGIIRSTYAKYETGENEPDLKTLQLLADYFSVSVDYLLGRNSPETLAAHRTDDLMADLPPEARKSLEEFIDSMKKLYGGKKE